MHKNALLYMNLEIYSISSGRLTGDILGESPAPLLDDDIDTFKSFLRRPAGASPGKGSRRALLESETFESSKSGSDTDTGAYSPDGCGSK